MLGKTNTGGGGVGGVLTVTAPAGVTVSVSKDGKVKTKTSNAEGFAVFKGLKTGTWQLTITDGSQVSTKPVVITADYSTVIAFFAATIAVTYPAGSTCACSDGVTTLTAPDTSGAWNCIVPNAGTWTITATNGGKRTERTVQINTDGQSEIIELAYTKYLFKSGDGALVQFETFDEEQSTVSIGTDNISVSANQMSKGTSALMTSDEHDLTPYSYLKITCKPTLIYAGAYNALGVSSIALPNDAVAIKDAFASTHTTFEQSSNEVTISYDISTFGTSMYIGFQYHGNMTVTAMWLE